MSEQCLTQRGGVIRVPGGFCFVEGRREEFIGGEYSSSSLDFFAKTRGPIRERKNDEADAEFIRPAN